MWRTGTLEGMLTFPTVLSCVGIAGEVGKEDIIFMFMRFSQERRYVNVPRQILALCYACYGLPERHGKWLHWSDVRPNQHDIASSTLYPARGAYDSYPPELIDSHVDMAKNHGVTGFIATR